MSGGQNLTLAERFKSIGNDQITSHVTEEKWSSEKIQNSELLKLDSSSDRNKLENMFIEFVNKMKQRTNVGNEHYVILTALYNLPKAAQKTYARSLGSSTFAGKLDASLVVGSASSSRPQTEGLQELQQFFDEDLSKTEENQKKNEDTTQKASNDIEFMFYCYVIAFLVKIVAKSSDNIIKSWNAMHERFKSFYPISYSEKLTTPSADWLDNIKSLFNADPASRKTLVKIIVMHEEKHKSEEPDSGLIRYLAVLPLAYTGLHGYKMFMGVREITGRPCSWLLLNLMHPKNNGGLETIYDILENYEARTNDPKDRSFKYARIIGPQYFPKLQTKACPALIYCLVKISLKYTKPGASSNPLSIVGIQTLGDDIRAVMDKAADLIFADQSDSTTGDYSEIMKKAMTASGTKAQNEDVMESLFN